MRRKSLFAALLVLGPGCIQTGIPPFLMMETSEILHRGEVSITASGVGGAMVPIGGGGGGLRLRVGLGASQELGLDADALFFGGGNYGGKLAWKLGPTPWFALVIGTGFSYFDLLNFVSFGGDVGLIFSSGRALAGVVRPYGGLRFSAGVPLISDPSEVNGVTVGGLAVVGLSLEPISWMRIYIEGGGLELFRTGDRSLAPVVYGGLGLSFIFNSPQPAQ